MPRFALGLVALGLALNLLLVVLLVGDAALPGRLSLSAAAVLAAVSGLSLISGLALLEPGKREADAPQAFSG